MRRLQNPSLVVLAACALMLAGGCGERAEPTAETLTLYPVTVRGGDERPVSARSRPERVAVLAPGAAATLAAMGAGRLIVGVPAASPKGVGSAEAPAVVDRTGRIQFAELARVRPDLIVASPTYGSEALERAGLVADAPVYVAAEDSLRDVERTITDLGLLVGEPLAARRLLRRIQIARERVATRVGSAAPVSVFLDTGFFTTVSDRSLVGELIRLAGGRNVAGANRSPGPFDLGLLRRRNPRVYLTTSDSETTLRGLRKNERTRRLAAVRAGRFRVLRRELLQPGPRIGEGLSAIARALHPDADR